MSLISLKKVGGGREAVNKDSNTCSHPLMSVFVSKEIALTAFHSFDSGINCLTQKVWSGKNILFTEKIAK